MLFRSAAASRPQVLELSLHAQAVVLCRTLEDVPSDACPVLQLLREGNLVIRRPLPASDAPGRPRVPLLAVLVPSAALLELSATQRAALLDQLAVLMPERPIPVERIQLAGVAGDTADLAALLSWVR